MLDLQNINHIYNFFKSLEHIYKLPEKKLEKQIDQIIKVAVKRDGNSLQYMPIEKQTDEIIKLAVQNYGDELQYVHTRKGYLESAFDRTVQSHTETLELACRLTVPIEKLSDEIIKLAIRKNDEHIVLRYFRLSEEQISRLKNEIEDEIFMLAVQNNYKALQYIPIEKLSDKICKLAVGNNSKALRYVPIDKMSIEIIKLALKNNGYVIIHVPIEKMSEEIIKLALENNSYILLHIPESKITDDIINFVIEKDGYNYNILQYLPIEKMPSDPITFESIHKDRAILIHKQLYDAKSLYKYIESNINATIPHNRKPFTQEMLLDIYIKSNYE